MENEQSFDKFYNSDLVPEIKKQELKRKPFKRKILKMIFFITIPYVLIYLYFFSMQGNGFWIFIIIFFLLLTPASVFYFRFKKEFTKIYKENVIKKIVHFISTDLTFKPTGGFPENQYLASELFKNRPDRYKAEDYIEGKIGDTFFRFSEVHSEYKRTSTDSKGRTTTSWHTIFKGVFFEADFNKDFKTKTFVMPDNLERAFGFIGKKLQSMNMSQPDLVKLEDPEFEKYFAVYGEDQVESRYILSTALMQRLTEFRKKRKHPVSISFVNNSIFVAITEHENLFEPRIFRTNLNKEVIKEYYSMLDLVIGIVDDLNLNNRIWTGSKMKT
jgi:organic radical activating enzyme